MTTLHFGRMGGKQFRRNVGEYNCAFAFTSFNYNRESRLKDAGQHGGVRSFANHGVIYHQI